MVKGRKHLFEVPRVSLTSKYLVPSDSEKVVLDPQRKSHLAKHDLNKIFPVHCMVFFAQHKSQRSSECRSVDVFDLSKPFMIFLTMFTASIIFNYKLSSPVSTNVVG